MTTGRERRLEPIVEAIELTERLAGLVDDVDAVAATMPARNALGLPVETHVESTEVAKLAHRVLRATVAVAGHRQRALNAAMRATTRSQARCLIGKDLVGGQLLLIEGLLLLLERLNLVLQSDLKDDQRLYVTENTQRTCSAMMPWISPWLSALR